MASCHASSSIHTYTVLYSNICVHIILIFKSKMINAMQCHSVVVMAKCIYTDLTVCACVCVQYFVL